MKGMNATTGRAISGIDHLSQSVARIVTTPLGSCIQRRTFGSDLPDLIDAPNNGATRIRLYAAVATALIRWEPRLTVTRVQLAESGNAMLTGRYFIDIEGWTDERDHPTTLRIAIPTQGLS